MAVLRPLKIVIENYPEGQSEELDAVNHPDDPTAGTRKIRFGRELYIERDDFMENPPKRFFRLSPGKEVRLRYAYFITCREVVKDAAGEVIELRCTYDPATRGGDAPDGRKVHGTHPLGLGDDSVPAEVRIYNSAVRAARVPTLPTSPPTSIRIRSRCWPRRGSSRSLATPGNSPVPVQFERQGYFCPDPDSKPGKLVFNRTVGLRDTWAKVSAREDALNFLL